MQKHGLVLDFTTTPVIVSNQLSSVQCQPGLGPLLDMAQKVKMKISAIAAVSQSSEEDCAVPIFTASPTYEMPACNDPHLSSLMNVHKDLFRTIPGKTMVTELFIPTNGNPVKVPPRQIPANY